MICRRRLGFVLLLMGINSALIGLVMRAFEVPEAIAHFPMLAAASLGLGGGILFLARDGTE